MKLEIHVSPIEINLNCRNVNADDFIYKQLAKLNLIMEKHMAAIDDIKAAIKDVKDAAALETQQAADRQTQSVAAIQALTDQVKFLQDQINQGNPITPQDVTDIITELGSVKTQVSGIIPDVPAP
ncbi:MAG TPA: hypothetical protein VK663_01080 [Burkholderiales bacterium]|nr:hypothetical protein [Burkholderiales bacterium]